MKLLDAAESFIAATPPRRCVLCYEASDEVREAVIKLRRSGMSTSKISAFLARTAESHGHGLKPSPPSVENHLNRHVDWGTDAAEKAKPRRRG